ncbi:MAG TPA: HAMP domain-containing sensor histidine kinase [Steroidobacteraceae bacterium]|nr:HAMP domain-containing sensor histidine kinase [Steroidobacteraceae bacterium]
MRSPSFRSSAGRLATLYVCSIVVSVSALLWTVYLVTQRALEREVDLVIETELEDLKEQYDTDGLSRLVQLLNRRVDSWGRTGAVYLLVDSSDEPQAGNLTSWPRETPDAGRWLEFTIIAREHGMDVDHPVRARIFNLGAYRMLVGTDVSERQRVVRRLRAATLWGITLTALFTALIGVWYSRRVAGRVRAVAETCERIISGDLAQRLPQGTPPDEFDQLAGAVNHMLDRIEHQTMSVRTTFGSAAHDLRAPLHRIRVRLESVQDGDVPETQAQEIIRDTVADLNRVQRTLAALLQIAQAESGALPNEETVDIGELAREMADLYEPAAREQGMQLHAAIGRDMIVSGNRQLLAQMIANLLENAIKYAQHGRIDVDVASLNDKVRLTVRDQGPGIPEAERAQVLLPFRRLARDEAQSAGSGLGLSLVAAVMRLHRGSVELHDNQPGLLVRCVFPSAPAGRLRAGQDPGQGH